MLVLLEVWNELAFKARLNQGVQNAKLISTKENSSLLFRHY